MANLYRKPIFRTDPDTGQRIKTYARKWWGQFVDASGRLRRHPLAIDKKAAQAMLNNLVQRVEREKAGLIEPGDEQRKRPLQKHLEEYRRYLQNKGITAKQVMESTHQIQKVVEGCKWKFVKDIGAHSALEYLGERRRGGWSAQTYNHYLKAVKSFTRWLLREKRNTSDPIAHVPRLNVATDRRHDRRALSPEEFQWLLAAARTGKRVEAISGLDRAMLYMLAAWTGFRKSELGSLTIRSFALDADPPTATVQASFSKRRRQDTQVLHPALVAELKDWLATRPLSVDLAKPLFPISGRVPGGTDRKTYKMMQVDLAAARAAWIENASGPQERRDREASDFLAYADHDGKYADFHSCRHSFITSLERSGISPRMAQTLARHSDIRLTLQTYTHVGLQDQTAAIRSLVGPSLTRQQQDCG